jgi:hypothetical protein
MARLMTDDQNFRDVIHGEAYRSYLAARNASPADYRFGSKNGKRGQVLARRAFTRVTASVLVSSLRRAVSALLTFFGPAWDGPFRRYRPEDHYMRGPGPKWREKQYKSASGL